MRPITIVGGGLAGLTLGIALRRQEIPVTIWEAGRYPRHRVCGEFISGGGPGVLQRLGLKTLFEQAGAIPARTVRFISGRHRSPVRTMPEPALCLSRYLMDTLLADAYRSLGGELRENARWTAPKMGEGVVQAGGRRPEPAEQGRRWFGMKVHARNVPLDADLEMHISRSGYVGVNRIDRGETNVCGLFCSPPGGSLTESKRDWLRGCPDAPLHDRLRDATFDDSSFCAVAGLSLKPKQAAQRNEWCIGDAVTMIPPVTGNGMSMAFESAELAAGPLAAYSRGTTSWTEARAIAAGACDAAFASRLVWARALQSLLFSPAMRGLCAAVLLRSDLLWRVFFSKTR